jgi:hypothetical protein
MYIQGSPAEIPTPTHWNLIDRSMTAPVDCVIAQQYPSATFLSLHFHSRKKKFGACLKNVIVSF